MKSSLILFFNDFKEFSVYFFFNYEQYSKSNTSYFIILAYMMSETDIHGMAVETEPSHPYSITFSSHVTDGSRGEV